MVQSEQCVLVCYVVRSDEMEIIMSDLDRANEVSFATSTLKENSTPTVDDFNTQQ